MFAKHSISIKAQSPYATGNAGSSDGMEIKPLRIRIAGG
jgi:hypothetical protein